MGKIDENARIWLEDNNYEDISAIIDEIMAEMKKRQVKTRRNWWEVLAGDIKGRPRTVYGKEIPVLKAAQIRQGVKVTGNAICRNEDEIIPIKRETNRWPKKE